MGIGQFLRHSALGRITIIHRRPRIGPLIGNCAGQPTHIVSILTPFMLSSPTPPSRVFPGIQYKFPASEAASERARLLPSRGWCFDLANTK